VVDQILHDEEGVVSIMETKGDSIITRNPIINLTTSQGKDFLSVLFAKYVEELVTLL
jgi:hypothetical protein